MFWNTSKSTEDAAVVSSKEDAPEQISSTSSSTYEYMHWEEEGAEDDSFLSMHESESPMTTDESSKDPSLSKITSSVIENITRLFSLCWPFLGDSKTENAKMNTIAESSKKQCVYICRYGRTEFALEEGVGPFDSDISSSDGIDGARCIGERLSSCLQEDEVQPVRIFASPFLRATHTAHWIAKKLGRKVSIECGIMEWMTSDLIGEDRYTPRTVYELRKLYDTVDTKYKSVLGPRYFEDRWEDEQDLYMRAMHVMRRLIRDARGDSILICSHAPCAQALALALETRRGMRPNPSKSKIGAWPLGGITMFSREFDELTGQYSEWKMELLCDTNHMPGAYRGGMMAWSLPDFTS